MRYIVSCAKVGGEIILYVIIPNRGCTKTPKCLFCGVYGEGPKILKIDEKVGRDVFNNIKKFIEKYSPDSLVLYNSGNILRPEEMFQPTILVDIPALIAKSKKCKAYEIEARADDVLKFKESVKAIKKNLGKKELRIRLGIEFFDDRLLKKHKKGISTKQIQEAVNMLNKLDLKWNGYVMLGGLDMNEKESVESAIKTGKFMIDNNAFKISINGIFITKKMKQRFGNRIYVPTYEDLINVIRELYKYRTGKNSKALFKVGFEEEDTENIICFPYVSDELKLEKVKEKLRDFNATQNIESLMPSKTI